MRFFEITGWHNKIGIIVDAIFIGAITFSLGVFSYEIIYRAILGKMPVISALIWISIVIFGYSLGLALMVIIINLNYGDKNYKNAHKLVFSPLFKYPFLGTIAVLVITAIVIIIVQNSGIVWYQM
ncbi:MAG: hypothetical protein Q7R84_00420 [bacterium]|nr:hypothetical protein [bacterium]